MENFFEGKQIFNLMSKFKKSKNFKYYKKEYESFKHIFNIREQNDTLWIENKKIVKNMVYANVIKTPLIGLNNIKDLIDDDEILIVIDESISFCKEIEVNKEQFKLNGKKKLNQLNVKELI